MRKRWELSFSGRMGNFAGFRNSGARLDLYYNYLEAINEYLTFPTQSIRDNEPFLALEQEAPSL
jgi:hypothetical protein